MRKITPSTILSALRTIGGQSPSHARRNQLDDRTVKRSRPSNWLRDWAAFLRALAGVISALTALLIVAERMLG